jgi:hypothetical protein
MLFASSQRSLKAYARGPSVLSGTYRDVAFVFSLEWELVSPLCETGLNRYHFIFWIAMQSAMDYVDRRQGNW